MLILYKNPLTKIVITPVSISLCAIAILNGFPGDVKTSDDKHKKVLK